MKIKIGHVGRQLEWNLRYNTEYASFDLSLEEGKAWLINLRPGNYDGLEEIQVEELLQKAVKEDLAEPERKSFRTESDHRSIYTASESDFIEPSVEESLDAEDSYENAMKFLEMVFPEQPKYREIVWEIVINEESIVSYCNRTGQKQKTISKDLFRAKKKMKKFLETCRNSPLENAID